MGGMGTAAAVAGPTETTSVHGICEDVARARAGVGRCRTLITSIPPNALYNSSGAATNEGPSNKAFSRVAVNMRSNSFLHFRPFCIAIRSEEHTSELQS